MPELYVRIKGRIQGPFGLEKLQGMVSRGQLSRIHQVSEDREVWKKAAEYPELFKSPTSRATAAPNQSTAQAAAAGNMDLEQFTSAAVPQEGDQIWYVEENGQPRGPMTVNELQDLIRTGRYESNSLVWREGMHDWVAANTVNELGNVARPRMFTADKVGGQASEQLVLEDKTIDILLDSRGWVILCAVILIIASVISGIFSFAGFVQGIKIDSDALIFSSIVLFGFATVLMAISILSFAYSSSLLKLRIKRDNTNFNASLRRLGRLWVCAGCVLVLGVLLFLISIILEQTNTANFSDIWPNIELFWDLVF